MTYADTSRLELFIKGALIGHLVADALALPFRWTTSERAEKIKEIEMDKVADGQDVPGVYSSNGASMMCLVTSINEAKNFDPDIFMTHMADWYVGGFMAPTVDNLEAIEADIATSQSIKRFTNAIPSDRTGSSDENAVECGALGRALPLGLFYATDSIDTLVDETCRFSRTTHNSLDSEVCCTLLAMIARNLFLQKAEKVFDLLEDYFKVKKKKDYVAKVQEVKAAKDKPGSNSLAIHCFWNAWESYSAKQRSYEGAVRYSIRHGGDTSTVASITGGLAGLTKGVNDIPRKWVRQMKLHPDVVEQAGIFVDLALARMTGQL